MVSRLFVKATDLDTVTSDLHTEGIADILHIVLPSGHYIIGFASLSFAHHHVANRHAKTRRMPPPQQPGGITPDIAALFPHVKAVEGMTPWELYKKLRAAHDSPLLDPELG